MDGFLGTLLTFFDRFSSTSIWTFPPCKPISERTPSNSFIVLRDACLGFNVHAKHMYKNTNFSTTLHRAWSVQMCTLLNGMSSTCLKSLSLRCLYRALFHYARSRDFPSTNMQYMHGAFAIAPLLMLYIHFRVFKSPAMCHSTVYRPNPSTKSNFPFLCSICNEQHTDSCDGSCWWHLPHLRW